MAGQTVFVASAVVVQVADMIVVSVVAGPAVVPEQVVVEPEAFVVAEPIVVVAEPVVVPERVVVEPEAFVVEGPVAVVVEQAVVPELVAAAFVVAEGSGWQGAEYFQV